MVKNEKLKYKILRRSKQFDQKKLLQREEEEELLRRIENIEMDPNICIPWKSVRRK